MASGGRSRDLSADEMRVVAMWGGPRDAKWWMARVVALTHITCSGEC